MPTIRIELFEGRTAEQKAALAREITDACVRVIGSPADSVDVLFFDIQRQNWATGGVSWADPSRQAAKPASS